MNRRQNAKPIRPIYTADNICEDDLCYAARIEAQAERTSWLEITEKESKDFREILAALHENPELDRMYGPILECAFENYDTDH